MNSTTLKPFIHIIIDLDEYHSLIEGYVTGKVAALRPYANTQQALADIQRHANGYGFKPPFQFQDEYEDHFNHDVALECARRLA